MEPHGAVDQLGPIGRQQASARRRQRGVALAFACVVLPWVLSTAGASAAPAGTITEFSAGLNAGSQAEAIASGPDGNLWFIDGSNTIPAIGRITPSGAIAEFSAGLSGEDDPNDIAAGPDGNLWFTDENIAGAIGRITPTGTLTKFHEGLNLGNAPGAIAPGPDGNLWFTDHGTTKAIGRITPSGTITEFSAGAGSIPSDIVPGPDGNVWFTDIGSTKAIGRITPSGTISEYFAGLKPEAVPAAIALGPDGNLWFTDVGTIKAIGKITPSGTITEYTTGLNPESEPVDIAPGPDGNLWFTDRGTTKAIGEITASGTISEYSAGLPAGSSPLEIAPGPDGNLWFTDRGTTNAIGRIVPEALAVPIVVTGGGQTGIAQLCSASWSTWAGQQPSAGLYGFDVYRWLLDGSQVATGPSYTPAAANVGHQLACAETVTYPLLQVTTSATSAPVTVVAAPAATSTTSPVVPPRITAAHQSSSRWREGNKLAQISRKKPPIGTTFSSAQRAGERELCLYSAGSGAQGRPPVVAQTDRNRHKNTCSRTVTAGALSFTGHIGTNKVVFQGRLSASRKLKPGRYTLIIAATNAAGQRSSPASLSFNIVK